MLKIGRPTKPKKGAPAKAKTRKPGAPEKAKRRSPPRTPPPAEEVAWKYKIIQVDGFREAEDRVERYLDRYTDKAAEVWVKGKLAYRVYGEDHPSVLKRLSETGRWMHGIHKQGAGR